MEFSNPPATPAPGPWSRRRRLTLGLTAVALVAGGGVAIAAGNADPAAPDPTEAATPSVAPAPAPGKAIFGLGGVLHSESVVSDGAGSYLTHLTQRGKIESIDSDRLTVVSEDGYKRSWNRSSETAVGGRGWSVSKNDDGSYTVKKDTEELAPGDQVVVVGTVKDGAATAEKIAAQPGTGEIPGMIMKRLQGEFGDRADRPMSKDRLMKGFGGPDRLVVPGPMDGAGPEVRRFEFRTPDGTTAPAPEPAVPAEPSSGVSSAPSA